MEKIIKFITDNKLSFAKGSRNTTVTTLIGYSQHLDLTKSELEAALSKEIAADSFIKEEIDRLWVYCSRNNYAAYWSKPEASKKWKF
jgi:hypothetical protein